MATYSVLVTGGVGFIGSHLVDRLVDDGHGVRIFDNLEPQVHGEKQKLPEYLNKKAEFIKGDVRDRKALSKALKDVEIVFHEAAAVGVGQSMYQIDKYMDVNTRGTANLLDILVNEKNSVKKLIVASSMSIYGEGSYKCDKCGVVYPELRTEEQMKKGDWELDCPTCGKKTKPIPTTEEKIVKPNSVYALSKKDQEDLCLMIGKTYGLPTVALRYFNVYGPRQSLSNPYTGVAAIFMSRIKNNNRSIIYEDGVQSRDFISVKDIVEANILAMNKSSGDYDYFNVGTGNPISIKKVAEVLATLYGSKLKPEITNRFRKGDVRYCYADPTKIRKKLGFTAKVSFEEGMKELVEWSRTAEAVDKSEQAHAELVKKGLVEK